MSAAHHSHFDHPLFSFGF